MGLSHRHAHRERGLGDAIADSYNRAAHATITERAIPTAIDEPTQTDNLGTAIAKATGEVSVSASETIAGDKTMAVPTSTASSEPSSSQTSDSDSSSGGVSPGVTAGIVFGVLGGILLISLLIYFIISRRHSKERKQREEDNAEKLTPLGPAPPTKDIPRNAPRLSLRLNSDRPAKATAPGAFERPEASSNANPFTNQAERAHSPTLDRSTKPGRQTSMYRNSPSEVDLTLPESRRPPSPSGTVFSMSSVNPGSGPAAPSAGAAAIAAAGGPNNTAVHRVQLDFKPSLSDEMELRAGDLVRLLHEYDDGWALCIRLDRSRQGVVPRTCLSTRPVKPRPRPGAPNGPPVNPQGQRPGAPYRPASPGGMRSQSPAGRPISPAGRSQSPAGRPRAPSKGHGPSPMNPSYAQDAPPGMAM